MCGKNTQGGKITQTIHSGNTKQELTEVTLDVFTVVLKT